jgi:hypothetical protein
LAIQSTIGRLKKVLEVDFEIEKSDLESAILI